jgi:hypothetical protein
LNFISIYEDRIGRVVQARDKYCSVRNFEAYMFSGNERVPVGAEIDGVSSAEDVCVIRQ